MPKIQIRRDTAANWKSINPVLLSGEWALETDTKKMKIGDGTTAYNALPYSTAEDSDEWRKPEDWIDIRSGALPNSIYFLVGHSADYSLYPQFGIKAQVSSSGTYDVYVDGIKQATTANNTATTLDWSTLNLTSGFDVTYPSALRVHIVRLTPSISTNKITFLQGVQVSQQNQGMLWIHSTVAGVVDIPLVAYGGAAWRQPLLEALTTNQESFKTAWAENAFNLTNLKTVPVIDLGASGSNIFGAFANTKIQKLNLENGAGAAGSMVNDMTDLTSWVCKNGYIKAHENLFANLPKLNHLEGVISFVGTTNASNLFGGDTSLEDPIFLDASNGSSVIRLGLGGTSSKPLPAIKGLTVSNEAPFDNTTSPQLDVSYTGMNRASLVNLFKSMPYNVGYTVVGSPTIVDGVVSGFSSSDYVSCNQSITRTSDIEFNVKFNADSLSAANGNALLKGSNQYQQMVLRNTGKLACAFGYQDGAYRAIVSQYTFAINTTYTINLSVKNNQYSLKIYDNNEQLLETETGEFNYPYLATNSMKIGVGYDNAYFSGSIDLNGTYIKVNGIPWFRGTAAMTKTISVVGCTGTSELTAADKAIAEDKGWAITLS